MAAFNPGEIEDAIISGLKQEEMITSKNAPISGEIEDAIISGLKLEGYSPKGGFIVLVKLKTRLLAD